MKIKLRPYQEDGKNFLLENKEALYVAGCGLGKTATTLSAIDDLALHGELERVLIIAPLNVQQTVWPIEAEQWDQFNYLAPFDLRAVRKGPFPDGHLVYSINYDLLPRVSQWIRELKQVPFDLIVFDESTKLKDSRGKRYREALPWWHKCKRRWGLTGAATPNHLYEIFGQMLAIDKGASLGKFKTNFMNRFFFTVDPDKRVWLPTKGAEQKIYKLIGHKCLRQSRKDHLGKPDLVEEEIMVNLPAKVHKQIKQFYEKSMLDKDFVALSTSVRSGKLIQMASGECYETTIDQQRGDVRTFHDTKIKALKSFIKSHKEPRLVFVNYIHEMDRLLEAFPEAERFNRKRIKAWNNKEIPLWIANPISCGHGLNLQYGGRIAVWYSLTRDLEVYDQANLRLRSGEITTTRVVRIVARGTIDELVLEKLRNKAMGQERFLSLLEQYEYKLTHK